MSKSCCERSQSKKDQICCTGTGECCSLAWGDMAKVFDENGATCVINCKNGDNCCTNGCMVKCKGKNGTKCELNCGCCSITVEKSVDDIGNYCKVTYCEDDGSKDVKSEKKKSVLTCCLRESCTQGKYCVVKCGGQICCVIKG